MPKNTMKDLRNHLFEVMEALKDTENPMEIARAKAVVDVAQTLVNSAKVEVDLLAAVGSIETTGFFGMPEEASEGGELRSAAQRKRLGRGAFN